MILGIDASNIRGGGGVTHLVELLKAANPIQYGFEKVYVWSGKYTLDKIENRNWLVKKEEPFLNKSLPYRVYWQRFLLSKKARELSCDILFIPGSSYSGSFKPYVTLSQNLLPFEIKEMKRYGFSWQIIRLILLRIIQSKTFKQADGVIFLTNYAKNCILDTIGKTYGLNTVIPHGINLGFDSLVKSQRSIDTYTKEKPYRVLYVSMIDMYKHQWNVCKAIASLYDRGYNLRLDLIGPSYKPALKKLNMTLNILKGYPIFYQGQIQYEDLHAWYQNADLFVFASSCENMPIILMESMVSGLPIASSHFGPMPEVLGSNGVYFNPEDSESISKSIQILIDSTELRTKMARDSYASVKTYSWQKCANDTFQFFQYVIQKKGEQKENV